MEFNKQKRKFDKPLFVYRISTPDITKIMIEMAKHLIEKKYVEYIFLENLDEINNAKEFKKNEKENYFRKFNADEEIAKECNLCIIIGGDGTCLWANSTFKHLEKPPFMCFHGGNLGFLTIYNTKDYKLYFEELYSEKAYSIIHRKEIQCTVYEKHKKEDKNPPIMKKFTQVGERSEDFDGYYLKAQYNALNEILLEKKANMSHLCIYLENHMLAKINSDGVICATPTGSTAYSLSAGGPILHNNVDGIIITTICPFSLSFRPIVLPENIKIRIKHNHEYPGKNSMIKLDGQFKGMLEDEQYLEISLSEKAIDFIVLKSLHNNLDKLWIEKMSKSLKWNFEFSH
jgi:NAD kinase